MQSAHRFVYALYVRGKQVNIRLTEEEHKRMRFWAYQTDKSLSDLAREALLEKVAALESEEQRNRVQVRLELA